MGNNMKITPPRKNQGKPKGGWHSKMLITYSREWRKLWLHGRPHERQMPQSPIREWADMDEAERQAIRDKVGG